MPLIAFIYGSLQFIYVVKFSVPWGPFLVPTHLYDASLCYAALVKSEFPPGNCQNFSHTSTFWS